MNPSFTESRILVLLLTKNDEPNRDTRAGDCFTALQDGIVN
jgi:hypothetical protein